MLRLRRYRVLLICAFVITVLLYHVAKNSQWDQDPEIWDRERPHHPHAKPKPPPPPPGDGPPHRPRPPPPAHDDEYDYDRPVRYAEPTIKFPQLKTNDGPEGGYRLPTTAHLPEPEPTKAPASIPTMKSPSNHDNQFNAPAKYHGDPIETPTTVHWEKPEEWFPVPQESLILLPTGKPKSIPAVQFAFKEESPTAKEGRELRLAKVKAEAQRAWSGYRTHAWLHDEVKPISNSFKDPFCGWAATLVDSLDTLWIMGMEEEFDEAVKAVEKIDFTTTPYRDEIPVFETVIRYLGGFLGAYDVSGAKDKYRILLDKAVELAEVLMPVFDTPNRMPILYYAWKPSANVAPKRASTHAGIAELGTLSMEFTRLAQLTGKNKYYDAVARITDALEELQNREGGTAIPGIFPENLDASGCDRSAEGPVPRSSKVDETTTEKRGERELPPGFECKPQKLVSSGYGGGSYSMGGSQDSAYEYFPKQYLLLGGLEPKYRTMHEKVVDAVKEHLLYRPMAKGDPDVLFSAKAYSSGSSGERFDYEWEITHLTCFLGGMYGLGGKIFERSTDIEIAKRLTDGCVWAYEVMPSGIMPEGATVMPCKKANDCHWNETAWHEKLDPSASSRAAQLEEYYERRKEWEREMEEVKRKQAVIDGQKQRKEAERKAAEGEEEGSEKRATEQTAEGEKRVADGQSQAEDAEKRSSSSELEQRDPSTNLTSRADEYDDTSEQQLFVPPEPLKPQTHQEYIEQRIKDERLPPGFVTLNDKRYILRPEAIESVWYMYRITGDASWQEKGWRMFEAVMRATRAGSAHSAIKDVTIASDDGSDNNSSSGDGDKSGTPRREFEDSMESFWLAETLKYFYLLFAEPDVISLDEWVLNTEAHPFRRPA